ncbi:uncharacterized protein [Pocillopora verrucosa]|uniref:uncharacterized protein n=1 Tax=Pocillopora verrucosa TaxID=203993 RepID=UPI0033425767
MENHSCSSILETENEMDPKHTFVFLITAVCFLAEGTARTFFLQSEFRKQNSCMGGNLMKFHKDTACQALKGPCQAKCDGASTRDVNTRFSIVDVRGLRCIQFTDKHSNTKYALKIKHGTNDIVFEKRQCDNSIGSDFLFTEKKVSGMFKYMHRNTMCLGISSNCDDTNLHLLITRSNDKRCLFKKFRRL